MSILDDAQLKGKEYLIDAKLPTLTEQNKQAQVPQQMQVPVVCATNLAIQATGESLSVILYNQVPDVNWNVGAPLHQVPIAILNLSIATAKDLMLMLMEIIPMHEQKFGEVFTPYMQQKGLRETSTKQ